MNSTTLLPIAELLAKSVLLLLGALLLIACCRRSSAAHRHAVLLAAFVTLLLLPLGKFVAPHWRLSAFAPARQQPISLPAIVATTSIPITFAPTPAIEPPKFTWPSSTQWLLGSWCAGAAFLLGFRIFGSWRIARLRRHRTVPANERMAASAQTVARDLGCGPRHEVRISDAVRVPCTWGLRRAVVLLPVAAEQWSEAHLLAALRHEFAHVTRRDYLTRWLSSAVCAIYWPNPLVWFAARQLYAAQEQACDDLVLRAGTPSADYATLLFETARACLGTPLGCREAIAMARPSTLQNRVVAVVDETRDRRPAGRFVKVLGALGAAGAVGVSALAQVAGEKPDVAAANPAQPPLAQVEIGAKFVEVPKGEFTADQIDGPLEKLKGADLLSAPRVTTRSGQRAMIQIGEERALPPGSEPKTQFVGTSLEVLPTVDGGKIQLQCTVEFVAQSGEDATTRQPIFNHRKITTTLNLASGGKVIMPSIPSDKDGREIFVLLEAKIAPPEAAQPRAGAPKKNEGGATDDPDGSEAKPVKPEAKPAPPAAKSVGVPGLPSDPGAPEAKPVKPKATNVPGQSIFSTRKPTTSVSVFDGQTVVLGGLVREDEQKVEDEAPSIGGKPAAVPDLPGDPAGSEAKPLTPAANTSGPAVKADVPGALKLPIEIDAKNISATGGMTVAEGNVRLKYGTATITADSVRYNPAIHRAEFRGQVEIKTEGGTMRGETMSVEFAEDGRIFIGQAGGASDIFLSAYMSFQQGEKAEATGKIETGIKNFNQTISLLDQVSQQWPTWNPEIVKHRRDRAAEALGKLQAKGSTGRPDAGPLNGASLPIQTQNGISGKVLAYNPRWSFVVLSIGDTSGLKAGANMVVRRGNTMIAKLKVTTVKPDTAIADLLPDSMGGGKVEPGDTVIFEGTR